MSWFRTKSKYGAALALMALAINFALAFGHCHVGEERGYRTALGARTSDDGHGPIDTSGDTDGCAICKALAAIATAVAPTAPALPATLSYAWLDRTATSEVATWQDTRADVRARGPPLTRLT